MSDPVAAFIPLARLALGGGFDGKTEERWVRPLAMLLEAASRGQGHLPLARCPVDEHAPAEFFAVTDQMVFLPRNAALWREVRQRIELLHQRSADRLPDQAVSQALTELLPPRELRGEDGALVFSNGDQRLAAAAFVDARIGVVTGGPGTGKTTAAAALLALKKRLEPSLRAQDVLLCAPTGKAACRLGESMKGAAQRLALTPTEREFLFALAPRTIHRALEWGPKPPEQGGPFGRGLARPLSECLVVVDEASMVDLDLMARLLRALAPDASLLLLGDSDQLDSVETGGVLAELVARGSKAPTAAELLRRRTRLGVGQDAVVAAPAPTAVASTGLTGLVIRLHQSYRARAAPWILELSAIARPGSRGTVRDFTDCCQRWAPNITLHQTPRQLYTLCREEWNVLVQAASALGPQSHPGDEILSQLLGRFQLLGAQNVQVERANRVGLNALWGGQAPRGAPGLPHGCPVLVTENRPALGLFNGDVGIALGTGLGMPAQRVVFPGLQAAVPVTRLPTHQPAFALTIHKSQGSEWDRVAIELPAEGELLDRHLLYTAISRSSGTLHLFLHGEQSLSAIL